MMEVEVDTRFRTFLRSCFLVEVIDGLKWFGIFGPRNYVRYYYRIIDTLSVNGLVLWVCSSFVVGTIVALVTLLIVPVGGSESLLRLTGYVVIVEWIIIPMVTMHSWYRWWKREVVPWKRLEAV